MAGEQPVSQKSDKYVVLGQACYRRSDKEQVPKYLDRELSIYVEGGKKI